MGRYLYDQGHRDKRNITKALSPTRIRNRNRPASLAILLPYWQQKGNDVGHSLYSESLREYNLVCVNPEYSKSPSLARSSQTYRPVDNENK
jgi:hypothetical protein